MRLVAILTVVLGVLMLQLAVDANQSSNSKEKVDAPVLLETFPVRIGEWEGKDVPIDNPAYLYGDVHLMREFRHRRTGRVVTLWIAHSKTGADRWHNPEVCMRAVGMLEDKSARSQLELGRRQGEKKEPAVQHYRFYRPGHRLGQSVFYWHFTIPPEEWDIDGKQGRAWWERAYWAARRKPESVTLEVFANETGTGRKADVEEFVAAADFQLRRRIPLHAIRGMQRAPIFVVRDVALKTSDE